MKSYTFHALGHPNTRATHPTTLQFTKDADIGVAADCIVGVCADFESEKLASFLKTLSRQDFSVNLSLGSEQFSFTCTPNDSFCSSTDIVFRKSAFLSERTLGVRSSKAARDIPREWVLALQGGERLTVVLDASSK